MPESSNMQHSPNDSKNLVYTDKKRVKVYVLENNEWKDTGTGFCQGVVEEQTDADLQFPKKQAYLLVVDEDADDQVLLKSRLERNIEYQRQEETLIVWKDLNGQDIALSFEESVGCDSLCEYICFVQKNIETRISLVAVRSTDDGIGSVHEIITGPVNLPSNEENQTEDSLLEALKILNENTSFDYLRNETIQFVINDHYLSILIKSFNQSERSKLYRNLLLLSNIIKTLILFNSKEIVEEMINEENFLSICGILEYDTEFPKSKLNHRQYLNDKEPKFKEMVPISDQSIKLMITQNFRLQFLKDVVLVRFLDDQSFTFISDLMLSYQNSIIDFLQEDGNNFINQVISMYTSEENSNITPDKRRDGIKLLHECVQLSQNLNSIEKTLFYKFLIKKGLFQVIQFAFNMETNNDVRILATHIIVGLIEHDIQLIQSVQNDEVSSLKDQNANIQSTDMSLLLILTKILLTDKSPGLREQSFQALVSLLDPEDYIVDDFQNHDDSIDTRIDNMLQIQNGKNRDEPDTDRNSERFQLAEYLQRFYKQVAPTLFHCFIDKSVNLHSYDQQLLIKLVKLLNLMIQGHEASISRRFILENGILIKLISLASNTYILQLRLAAVRCFKNVVFLNDDFYLRYLIGKNLFDPVFQVFKENLHEDNIANSTILDFLKSLNAELKVVEDEDRSLIGNKSSRNFLLLNKYICGRYGDLLQSANYVTFTQEMMDTYNEEMQRLPSISTTETSFDENDNTTLEVEV
ncbi:unnamed protein product [Kluyveromyces dobzhanskii CBS 2104]|uniref:WGS project CCBQ000000000 data, contig 00049 n=1 Tax=Kluyveromyces dobzhanskii CBS 2104 TaxID=1427455 RepID=A0A0A8L7F7_9SACH|nr:unnamed protein product [Kluyveromyces dobzhanskii CBS 2104]